MFDLSPEKLLVIALIAVMVLGPDRLPKAARTFAKVLHQVRTATGSLQAEMAEALAEPRNALNDAVGDLGIPTDLRVPRIPTTRSIAQQVFAPTPVTARSRTVEPGLLPGAPIAGGTATGATATAGDAATTVDRTGGDLLPDDPSYN